MSGDMVHLLSWCGHLNTHNGLSSLIIHECLFMLCSYQRSEPVSRFPSPNSGFLMARIVQSIALFLLSRMQKLLQTLIKWVGSIAICWYLALLWLCYQLFWCVICTFIFLLFLLFANLIRFYSVFVPAVVPHQTLCLSFRWCIISLLLLFGKVTFFLFLRLQSADLIQILSQHCTEKLLV